MTPSFSGFKGKRVLLSGCSAAVLISAGTSPALAEVDEIVVTAQKREESIQDVPVAITALSGDFTRAVNLNDIKDLVTYTPGVTGNSQDSFIDTLSVRGILTNDFGIGGDPAIGVFKNGLYQGRNGAVVSSLFDIERAEVLRGPQGFLFGRSAIGGAVSVHTAKPVLGVYEGYAEIDAGSRARIIGEGAINIPFGENFATRVAVYGGHENGFIDNVARPQDDRLGGYEKVALRVSNLYENGPFSGLFTVEYEDRDQDGTSYRAIEEGSFEVLNTLYGATIGGDGRDIDSDLPLGSDDRGEILSFGLQIDYDFDAFTLTSLTGYKEHEFFYTEDFDGTPLASNAYSQDQEGRYFEQEVRIVSSNEGPLSWYAGASYFNEDIDADFVQQASEDVMCAYYYYAYYYVNTAGSCLADVYGATAQAEGLVERNQGSGRYDGWSVYVDSTYAISDKVDIGVGLRYTDENKDFGLRALPVTSELGPFFALGFTTDGFLNDSASFDGFTPRFVVRYRPTENLMIFANVARGFKSGGFGSFSIFPDQPGETGLTQADAAPDQFDPETVWSYELGAKAVMNGARTRFDANAFYYEYKDLQLIVPGGGGGIVVDNVGAVEGWGFEGSFQTALGEYFDLMINGAYADTSVTGAGPICDDSLDCEGNGLGHVPSFSGAAVLNFAYPVGDADVVASAEIFGQSERYADGSVFLLDEARIDGYADLTLRFGYRADAWDIIGYVENVTDALYYDGSAESAGVIPAHYFGPSRPRTYGVKLSYSFGG